MVGAFDNNPNANPELKEAIDILRDWDFRTSASSVAMTLAHYYGLMCLSEGDMPTGLIGNARLNHFGTNAPVDERLTLFTKVIENLKSDFGSWNQPWGEVNRFQRLNGEYDSQFDDSKPSMPIGLASGRWGALAAYGARTKDTKKLYGYRGNSFVAVVEFGDQVKAKSLLAGGQASDPSSPHFVDQADIYAAGEFKDVAYYKEDVEAVSQSQYHPGER